MTVPPSRPPPALELRQLFAATRHYLTALEEARHWTAIEVDVNRIVRPDYAGQLGALRGELRTALKRHEMGTPAGILRVLTELMGETST